MEKAARYLLNSLKVLIMMTGVSYCTKAHYVTCESLGLIPQLTQTLILQGLRGKGEKQRL